MSNTSFASNANRPTRESLLPKHPRPQRICEYFMAEGTCRYGNNCKYSHVKPDNDSGGEVHTDERPEALLFKLKREMKSFSNLKDFQSLGRFEEFLDIALKVLDSTEREVRAEVILVLTVNDQRETDNTIGYDLIRFVVDKIGCPNQRPLLLYPGIDPLRELDTDRHIVPFMKILVHDAFVESCVEKSFHFVIKATYGPDGERGSRFLKKIVARLEEKSVSCNTEDLKTMLQEPCFLLARLLHYIVRYSSEAIGHTDLLDVHVKLKELSRSVKVRTPLSAQTDRYLAQTAARLLPPKLHPGTEQDPSERESSLDIRYQQHEFLVDLPGELSNSVPRHDNDSARIAKISILPTRDEVLSLRDPYLPINDIAAPHFLDGASRLLDINFRLLREDMIGPLRNAVNLILQKLSPEVPISKQLSHQNYLREPNMVSTRLYFDVSVESAQFVKNNGLTFQLRFRQPRQRNGVPHETIKSYWDATKSLDRGSLLCLVSNTPDFICFLTVVEKQTQLLCKDPDWCWIDVTPEGKVDHVRESLLQNIRRKLKVSLALVEFPGVLLASFKTILESLQTRSPFLPFSNILCPQPDERQAYDSRRNRTAKVPPPLYSLGGFQFNLQPLKNSRAYQGPLFLSSEASPDDHELLGKLERESTLDSGQCKGLIAALTQEVALIQGDDLHYL
jgi:Zinc finger C-x8-C-x5-C-x3-H type (and similar)